jgi:hypothetical protein
VDCEPTFFVQSNIYKVKDLPSLYANIQTCNVYAILYALPCSWIVSQLGRITAYPKSWCKLASVRRVSLITLFRTLIQLQPDILVAKLSRSADPPPHLRMIGASDHHSISQLNNRLTTKTVTPSHSGHYWSCPSIFGGFWLSRTCYSVMNRKKRDVTNTKKEVEVVIVQYRSPSWLANRMWNIQAVKASYGWDISLRAYNVVHRESPVLKYARDNNVRGLQELFSERIASPFDCDDDGWTPLAVSLAIFTEWGRN